MGGDISSGLSSKLYTCIVLLVSEPIEVGEVTGSLEPSCNTEFSPRNFWEWKKECYNILENSPKKRRALIS